jgi:hypothetical protein
MNTCTDVGDAGKLLRVAHSLGLNVVGVSFHVGSACKDLATFSGAIESARAVRWRPCFQINNVLFQRGDSEAQNGFTFCMLLGQVALTGTFQAQLCYVGLIPVQLSLKRVS